MSRFIMDNETMRFMNVQDLLSDLDLASEGGQ